MLALVPAKEPALRLRIREARTRGAGRSLRLLLAAAIGVLAAYVCVVAFALGVRDYPQQILDDIVQLRRILYERRLAAMPPGSPKAIYVAGSGTLFSLDSGLIERQRDLPGLNLGLHAGLDLDLLFAQAIGWVGRGDRVIAPLEFEIYGYAQPTDFTEVSFLAGFFRWAPDIELSHLLRIATAISPVQALQAAWTHLLAIAAGGAPVEQTDAQRLATWQTSRAPGGAAGHSVYDYSTMNGHGDKDLLLNPTRAQLEVARTDAVVTAFASADEQNYVTDWARESLAYWRTRIQGRGAKLYLVWPIVAEDDLETTLDPVFWKRLIAFARQAAESGNPIYCDPIDFVTPIQYRYDTQYHFNIKGQDLYSRSLAACLADIDHHAFDYEHADPKVLAARARARIEALKAPPDPLYFAYERNIRELQGLERELRDIHTRSGTYPEALPALAEPASSFPAARTWYRSSGADYKLLIEDPDECRMVRLGWPGMIDPKRTGPDDCGAYGYWTAGAADW